jgi:glycosyltransferase involved in cell wall biosynthesis
MVDVSIVIPTYNRVDRLKQVFTRLEEQDFPVTRFEVIVVSDGSTDGTDEFLKTCRPGFHLTPCFQKNQGAAAARNLGVQMATGDIVLFIDDDILPEPRLISEHWNWYQDFGPNVVVIGPMLSPKDFRLSPWVNWEQVALEEQYHAMSSHRWKPTPRQFYTGNVSLERRNLITSGGFDVSFRRAEDVELAYRLSDLGLQFLFNPNAVGYHYAERSLKSWMDTPYMYGRNDVIFTHQKGQTWLLPLMLNEFQKRNFMIRLVVQACLGRPRATQFLIAMMKAAIGVGETLHAERLALWACSAIFNLRYYTGVADQLGGTKTFYQELSSSRNHD